MVILDELTYTITYGWTTAADVVEAVAGRSARTNVVITGRDAPNSWNSPTPSPRCAMLSTPSTKASVRARASNTDEGGRR